MLLSGRCSPSSFPCRSRAFAGGPLGSGGVPCPCSGEFLAEYGTAHPRGNPRIPHPATPPRRPRTPRGTRCNRCNIGRCARHALIALRATRLSAQTGTAAKRVHDALPTRKTAATTQPVSTRCRSFPVAVSTSACACPQPSRPGVLHRYGVVLQRCVAPANSVLQWVALHLQSLRCRCKGRARRGTGPADLLPWITVGQETGADDWVLARPGPGHRTPPPQPRPIRAGNTAYRGRLCQTCGRSAHAVTRRVDRPDRPGQPLSGPGITVRAWHYRQGLALPSGPGITVRAWHYRQGLALPSGPGGNSMVRTGGPIVTAFEVLPLPGFAAAPPTRVPSNSP